jgi:hypothetical protein
MNHQEYQVFFFGFTASGKRHNITVASTNREEARALILASFDDVLNLRERVKKAGRVS